MSLSRTGWESWISCMSSWDSTSWCVTTILKNVCQFLECSLMQIDKIDMIWRVSHQQLLSSSDSPWWNHAKCHRGRVENLGFPVFLSEQALTNMNWPWSWCSWCISKLSEESEDLKTNEMTKFIFHCVEQASVSRLTALSQSSAPPYLKSCPWKCTLVQKKILNCN